MELSIIILLVWKSWKWNEEKAMKEKWYITSPKQEADDWNSILKVSPWSGHRNFVYDLLKYMEPKKIIELGTHYGCSFFAMCQSIKDNQLNDTEIFAVDTWKGDEQAGHYGEEVWNKVNEIRDVVYTEVKVKFLKMYFDEANSLFENETFDLIHIDGLHTYEAVSHDFSVWLSKLKKNGIVLFHDVHSELNYGSDRFWKEIQQKYRENFEFTHSWGLGILFPKGDLWYQRFLEQNFEDKMKLYEYKAISERKELEVADLTSMADERYEAIQNQSCIIEERNQTIQAQTKLCEERYRAIQEQEKLIEERNHTIKAQAELCEERYNVILKQEEMIKERDDRIQAQAKLCEERYRAIQEQEKMIEERDAIIQAQVNMCEERYRAIQEQSKMIEERDATIQAQADMCEERYAVMQEQGKMIAKKEIQIGKQENQIQKLNRMIRKKNWKQNKIKKGYKKIK